MKQVFHNRLSLQQPRFHCTITMLLFALPHANTVDASSTLHLSLTQTFVLKRCTTGTELGGKLPYSVITMLM
jgi:hypothetical protein